MVCVVATGRSLKQLQVQTAVDIAIKRFGRTDVLVNSAGVKAVANAVFYSTSKFAVEAISLALVDEVAPFGIKPTAIDYVMPTLTAHLDKIKVIYRKLAEEQCYNSIDIAAYETPSQAFVNELDMDCLAPIERSPTSVASASFAHAQEPVSGLWGENYDQYTDYPPSNSNYNYFVYYFLIYRNRI